METITVALPDQLAAISDVIRLSEGQVSVTLLGPDPRGRGPADGVLMIEFWEPLEEVTELRFELSREPGDPPEQFLIRVADIITAWLDEHGVADDFAWEGTGLPVTRRFVLTTTFEAAYW